MMKVEDWNQFFPPGTRVMALPNWENPRLYLPAGRSFRSWRESSFYPAYRARARLYRLLLRGKATAGVKKSRMVRSNRWPLGEFVQDVLSEPNSVAVLVGTAGPAQKFTAQLRYKEGRILGYIKYAYKDAARARLRQEHYILSHIAENLGPAVLKYGEVDDANVLLTAPVAGRRVPPSPTPGKEVVGLLKSFVISPPIPADDHPWIQSLKTHSGMDPELEFCVETLGRRSWPIVIQHGDFAPWNLRRVKGAIRALDWEYGNLEGFPYLDLVYYILQTLALIRRWTPEKAARYAARYLIETPQLGLREEEAWALVRLTAYDAYSKSRLDGQLDENRLQTWRRAIWRGQTWSG